LAEGGRVSLPFFGISAELDVVERGNPASMAAYTGGMIGITLCYSGGNIGEGPGPHAVIICAGMASVAFFLVWFVLTAFTEIDYTVTVDRDLATGFRLGAFLLAPGFILGRSVVGDYYSAIATWNDFIAHGWPVLLLLGLAIVFEFFAKLTVARPVPSPILYGIIPAIIYIGAAVRVIFSKRYVPKKLDEHSAIKVMDYINEHVYTPFSSSLQVDQGIIIMN
jgi:uncharacterized membrane protein YjfL (UPF0719 family)